MSNETVTDIDGNVYTTVKIGNQIWTVENLRTTKYNDGTPILHVIDDAEWSKLKTGAYCYYMNDDSNMKYGALYNWFAVETEKLAPEGWRVPTYEDWDVLRDYLIANGYNWDKTIEKIEYNKLGKALASNGGEWQECDEEGCIGNNQDSNNSSGFSALPGGYRNLNGGFNSVGNNGYWWSATEYGASNAYNHGLYYDKTHLHGLYDRKRMGLSVRLVRDAD